MDEVIPVDLRDGIIGSCGKEKIIIAQVECPFEFMETRKISLVK
jgi:hypothetical protein